MGNPHSVAPGFFAAAGVVWLFVSSPELKHSNKKEQITPNDKKDRNRIISNLS
jgi:hypothetical protein